MLFAKSPSCYLRKLLECPGPRSACSKGSRKSCNFRTIRRSRRVAVGSFRNRDRDDRRAEDYRRRNKGLACGVETNGAITGASDRKVRSGFSGKSDVNKEIERRSDLNVKARRSIRWPEARPRQNVISASKGRAREPPLPLHQVGPRHSPGRDCRRLPRAGRPTPAG